MKLIGPILCVSLALIALVSSPSLATSGNYFATFIGTAKTFCPKAPAIACVERLWPFADQNQDGAIQLTEAEALYQAADLWSSNVDRKVKDQDRDVTLLALLVIQSSGLKTIFAAFDSDADGGITREELLADFRLDGRPFGELVKDSEAVDWSGFASRFGVMGSLMTPAPGSQ